MREFKIQQEDSPVIPNQDVSRGEITVNIAGVMHSLHGIDYVDEKSEQPVPARKTEKTARRNLHIRTGEEMRAQLVEAGIVGGYLSVGDPAWLGPPTAFNA